MKKRRLLSIVIVLAAAAFAGIVWSPLSGLRAALAQASPPATTSDAEARVIAYLRAHVQPGQPLVVSELYSKVLTKLDERQALNKLYNAFFRIPLFLVQYQEKYGSPPNKITIAQQFDLRTPGAAEVLLQVMESDPRVPRFLTRDSKTGEITRVDVEMVRSDPKFGQAVARQLSGWEGKPAPGFKLDGVNGHAVDSNTVSGRVVLLYVWFTGCPPCMKETPGLVALQNDFSPRGFSVVGANADRVLGLGYGDEVRQRYIEEQKINFPVVHWSKESDAAYGNISIFPTLFLIDGKGIILHHWVGYVKTEELRRAIAEILG